MAIKSNELRIGNLVSVGFVGQVESIEEDSAYINPRPFNDEINEARHQEQQTTYDGIKPIPLTEEWLLKFGFEKKDKLIYDNIRLPDGGFGEFHEAIDYMLGVYKCQVLKKDNNFFYLIEFSSGDIQDDFITKEIKYVHQLQNLYFSLTGEELNLTKQ